ncbi:MAG: hypothetical protein E7675_03060 [Ruminococcaceae bacterium]|nr:hypothetical protein [Oscillospiraceae bacterium]
MKKITALFLALLMMASSASSLIGINVFAEATNVALGKPVSGSGSGADMVTDGNRTTSGFWDGGVAPAEVVIDLGGFYDITKANVVTYFGDGRYYHFTVQTSDNGITYTTVGEKSDNATAKAEGTDFSFEATARYVKVQLTKNSANPSVHLVEVEVYGVENPNYEPPAVDTVDPNDPDNIAFYKPTRSNSTGGIAGAANDGDTATVWSGIDYPKYVDIDLLANYDISKIVVHFPKTNMFLFDIYGSSDGVNYTKIASAEKLQICGADGFVFEFDKPIDYRIIRVNVTYNSGGQGRRAEIADIKIYGKENDTKVTPTRETLEFTSYDEWLKENHGVDLSKIKDKDGKYDIDATYTEQDTVKELNALVTRIIGEKYVSWFEFDVEPVNPEGTDKDYYKIEDSNGKIKITGTDGTCIAAGLNWYLKYYCKVHIAQQTKQVNMPDSIVKVGESVFMDTSLKVRYAYNYCTLSYSMAFFGYDDWRRELDWLMLNGINLVLDITATEALWVHYLQRLGYNADQGKDYVCGYAYKAWWLMGNLENYGGSVSDQWVIDTLEMARVNQRSLTVMGAEPALQTFVGAMPSTFGTLAKKHLLDKGYEDVSKYLAPQGGWSGLTRPNVLRTDYDGYTYLAQMFYDSQNYLYGQITDYYCGDVCHEGGKIPEGLLKEDMASKILEECMAADENAVWMLQVWWENPMKGVLDGFGEYRTTNVILIDLAAAHSPKYTNTTTWGSAEYGGTPWIFSTLDNYGGRAGMHGRLLQMCRLIETAKNSANYLAGIGMTPEGTLQNPVMYDLFWEMTWRDEAPNVNAWIVDYIERRYGEASSGVKSAWTNLLLSVYKDGSVDGTSVNYCFTSRPKFDYTGGYYVQAYANITLYNAITSMMKDFDKFSDNECYVYDLVDMMRTYLSNVETDYLAMMRTCANAANSESARTQYMTVYEKYMSVMLLVDELSSYIKDELLGTWIGRVDVWVEDDRTGKYDDYTIDTMKFNAKCLISSWCSYSLIDYANRQYSGLIADYYYPSWVDFFETTNRKVASGKISGSDALAGAKHYSHAWNFINNGKEYTTVVSDANGNETSRGLKVIFDKIAANHTNKNYTALVELKAKKDSGVTVSAGLVTGLPEGLKVNKLSTVLDYPEGYTVSAVDAEGKKLDGNAAVAVNGIITLNSADGKRVDAIIVSTLGAPVTDVEPDVTVTPDVTETPDGAVTPDGSGTSTEAPETAPKTDIDEDKDNSTVIIIVAVAAIVAVIAVAAVIIIKKRK